MFRDHGHQLMARAMELAARGRFSTHPNPRVGCVIARDGRIVGEGWHRRAGEEHAEVHALAAAGDAARGATAYVTLEPCCHTGRTGPCTEALLAAGIRKVVAAMEDPDPRVAGDGLRRLRQAGVEVASGLMSAQARALNPGFVARLERGRPYLRAKLAMSLDGRTALASGESKWITGTTARSDVQAFRAMSDAILTGVDTIIADDPRLDVRAAELPAQYAGMTLPASAPLRVIMDTHLRCPPTARVFTNGPTLIAIGEGTDSGSDEARETAAGHASAIEAFALRDGRVSPGAVLARLAAWPINEVWLEAGATLCGSLLAERLVDELVVYCAPCLLGSRARGLVQLPDIEHMGQRMEFEFVDLCRIGQDLRIIARPRP